MSALLVAVLVTAGAALTPAGASAQAPFVDGHVGGAYVKLAADSVEGGVDVTYQVGALDSGTIALRSVDPVALRIVGQSAALCRSAGNVAPGPHPVVSVELGPDQTPVQVDTYLNGTMTGVCLTAGDFEWSVGFDAATFVRVVPAGPAPVPPVAAPPASYPSGECAGGQVTVTPISLKLNGELLYAAASLASDGSVRLCARGGAAGARTKLAPAAGQVPSVGTDTNTAACAVPLLTGQSPVPFRLATTPVLSPTTSLCAEAGGMKHRVFAGVDVPALTSAVDVDVDPIG